jgi:hypothetical protein
LGINYVAPAGKAYYPCVLFDTAGFGGGTPQYRMWYSDGSTGAFLVTSPDGANWSARQACSGLTKAHHVQVLYDANGFGGTPNKYRIWYWDCTTMNYTISDMRRAVSVDGITWTGDAVVAQDAGSPIISGVAGEWNGGTYGPVCLFYNSAGSATLDDANIFNNKYVMYYDATTGGFEQVGLAYSVDGNTWKRYGSGPVLPRGGAGNWDSDYASYGTIIREGGVWHFWYSGSGPAGGANQGIGYASSSDGLTWTRDAANPIFHITDPGATHRSVRTATPSVVRDPDGLLRMYYTAENAGGTRAIGLAMNGVIAPTITSLSPASTRVGGSALLLDVTGSNFRRGSVVRWNGMDLVTFWISDTEVVAIVPASMLVATGTANVTVFVDAPGGTTSAAAGFTIVSNDPVVDSVAAATPNPAATGQSVIFTIAGHAPDGQAVIASWDFGDGTVATGIVVTHTYSLPGVFQVTATLTSSLGTTSTSSVQVTIAAGATAGQPEPLTITKKRLRAKNPSTGADTCQVSGSFALPAGVSQLEGALRLQIGSASLDFTLDSKGKAKTDKSSFRVKAQSKKGVLLSQTVQFKTKAVSDFAQVLANAGLAAGASGDVTLPVQVTYAGKVYAANMPLSVTGSEKGATGK